MKLYELKRGSVFEVDDIGWEGREIIFERLDGLYSYCISHDENGEEVVVHVSACAPVKLIRAPKTEETSF